MRDPERDVVVVVAHPDDEVLWLSGFLPTAREILVAYPISRRDGTLTEGRARAMQDHPLPAFRSLGLESADVFAQSDFLSRAPADYGVTLMRSSADDLSRRYRANYATLTAAVEPSLRPGTDICTHNPWGEYGHEEHIQVSRAMVDLAVRHRCSVWAWDGLPAAELAAEGIWLRADYYPDDDTAELPSIELPVDTGRFEEIRALYRRHGAWTWRDDFIPPDPSRYVQLVREGEALVTPRRLPAWRRIDIAARVLGRKSRYYAGRAGARLGRRVESTPTHQDV